MFGKRNVKTDKHRILVWHTVFLIMSLVTITISCIKRFVSETDLEFNRQEHKTNLAYWNLTHNI
jgi:hypothetical protein